MKKNVFFAPWFLYNLALITHYAIKSVKPSILNSNVCEKKNFTIVLYLATLCCPRIFILIKHFAGRQVDSQRVACVDITQVILV